MQAQTSVQETLSKNNSPADVVWCVQRRQYFTLLQQKHSDLWTNRVNADQSRKCRLWRSFDELLYHGRAPPSSDADASTLHRFFDDKVAGIPVSTNFGCSHGFDQPTLWSW